MTTLETDKLVLELAEDFVRKHFPQELARLHESAKIVFSGLRPREPDGSSDHFIPVEVLGTVIAPVVLGIVSAWLYDVLKIMNRGRKARSERKAELESLARFVRRNRRKLRTIEGRLARRTGQRALVHDLIQHCVRYVETVGRDAP